MNRTIQYLIDSSFCGVSVYDYLKLQGYSSKCISDLKKMDHSVCVENTWIYMNHILQEGEVLTIHISELSTSSIVPTKMDLCIIYEDEDILVLNKPANLPVHPSMNHYEDTLANGVMHYYASQGIPMTFRCMNRIDADTTGLVLLAKHLVSASILGKMIQNDQVKRQYLALVSGTPSPSFGTIHAPIARVSDSTIMRHVDFTCGDHAITHYETLHSTSSYSLLKVQLETGRTHQIRVHMSWIGHPLLGDSLYSSTNNTLPRQGLHSAALTFIHPIKKELLSLEAPLPDDMQLLLKELLP